MSVTDAWSRVPYLFDYLMDTYAYREIRTIRTVDDLDNLLENNPNAVKPGDVICFLYDGDRPGHAAMVGRVTEDNIWYYAHSSARGARTDHSEDGVRFHLQENLPFYIISMR